MTPERERTIERICQEALEHAGSARTAFLTDACGGDTTLRREIESLLAQQSKADGFLSTPAFAVAGAVEGDGPSFIGRQLGPYTITARLGAGGMGEVYRARDTKLGREVAIKVLPPVFISDPDRRARFEREARVLAALNHPHVGAIYGLEDVDGIPALVLELVEGETLADRLARSDDRLLPQQHLGGPSDALHESGRGRPSRRPSSIEEALDIARQIAEGLEAAHEHGIIHRDLKPANIKITPDGNVKVLDFGLAKAAASDASHSDLTRAPTVTSGGTHGGLILGTAAYMSPEQARGQAVDKRTDIWAFGCVLFEMLAGDRAFRGDTISDTIAAVIDREPDWSALPADTPVVVLRLLRRCLAKDRKRRLADIADARLDLEEALTPSSTNIAKSAKSTKPAIAGFHALPWTVAAAAVVMAGLTFVLWSPWSKVPSPAPLRLTVELGADASLVADQGTAAVLSPDGAVLAFVAQKNAGGNSQLYIRRLEQLQATALSGTDGARNPFFSPDGQWIAFFAGGKLKKMSVSGGDAITVCDALNGLGGGTWTGDGTIVFSPNATSGTGLWRVSSAGGKPELLTTVAEAEGESVQRWPQVLPGGKAILYTSQAGRFSAANIVVQSLPNGPRKVLLRGGYLYGRYLPSGHLIYLHDGTLFAAAFDVNRLELVGQAVPALEGVAGDAATGGQFAVSANGTLAYVPGQAVSDEVAVSWLDQSGKTTLLRATPANWSNPSFAPDGQRLAMDVFDGRQVDVWIYDWTRDALSRLTFDASDDREPVWTPDGRRIAFGSTRDAKSAFNLYWQRADGTGEAQRLTAAKNTQYPASWHPSGRFLIFVEASPRTGNDLMILPMEGDERSVAKPGKPYAFLNSPSSETYPMFSPDGRWVAYASDESGQNELYVRPFPGPGGKWQISTEGGAAGGVIPLLYPSWSRTRQELFYSTPDGRIMVVPYKVDGDVFAADKPRLWSPTRFMRRPRQVNVDLHPDGGRFAVAAVPEAQTGAKLDKVVLIFNFFDELRRMTASSKP